MELPIAEAPPRLQVESKKPFSHILDLPNELLLMISKACFFNTATSLRQSCRTLFNALCDPRARLRPRDYNVNVYFERLCMDDEYKSGPWGRAVCSVCQMCHPSTDFTLRQLERNPTERVCEGAQRLLYVAPNTSWSYQELLQKKKNHSCNVSLPLKPPHQSISCRLRRHTDISTYWMVAMDWSINLHGPTTTQPIVIVCPHMTSVHPRIMQMIDQLRSRVQDEEWSKQGLRDHFLKREQSLACLDCNSGTQISMMCFGIKPGKAILFVTRLLGPLSRPASHPNWIAQSAPSLDAEQDFPAEQRRL